MATSTLLHVETRTSEDLSSITQKCKYGRRESYMKTQVPENMNTFCHILLPLACSAKQNMKWRKQGHIGVCGCPVEVVLKPCFN